MNIGLSDICALDKKLDIADAVLLGPGISNETFALSRKIKELNPRIQVISFVSDKEYSTGSFIKSRDSGVRIVLPQRATPLDLLQVLVAIDSEQRVSSCKGRGQLSVFVSGKGGLGATTLVAALGDHLANQKRKALLWDLDIETRDLSRAVLSSETRSARLTDFVRGEARSTKATLKAACVKWHKEACVLPPPDILAAGLDLISHPDSITLLDEIIECARELFDHVLVDLGGRLGAGAAKMMQLADNIFVLVDDSWLGLTATAAYLNAISPILHGNFSTVNFVGAGTKLSVHELKAVLEKQSGLKTDQRSWRYGAVPFDAAARRWPGSGETLFSIGSRATKQVVAQIGDSIEAPLARVVSEPVQAPSVELITPQLLSHEQLDVSHPFAAKPELAKSNRAEIDSLHTGEF